MTLAAVASGERTTWKSGVSPSHVPVAFEFEAIIEAPTHDAASTAVHA